MKKLTAYYRCSNCGRQKTTDYELPDDVDITSYKPERKWPEAPLYHTCPKVRKHGQNSWGFDGPQFYGTLEYIGFTVEETKKDKKDE